MKSRALAPEQLVRNAASGPVRYGSAALLGVVVTPCALHVLGSQAFGVWALAGAVLTTLQFLDLGLTRAITRDVASAIGGEDPLEAVQVLAAGRSALLMLAVTSAGLVCLFRHPLAVGLFQVPTPLVDEATIVIAGTALVAALQLAMAPYAAALDGLGRMDLSNGIDTLQRIASSLGVVVVLALGWGLVGLVAKNLVTVAAAGVGYRWALNRQEPLFGQLPMTWDSSRIRKLTGFGRHVQLTNAGAALIEPLTKTVLARGSGMESVAFFELAWRVVASLSAGFMAAATALFPAAATAQATESLRGGRTSLVRPLHSSSAALLAWFALPCYAISIALARPFATAWLGPAYAAVGDAMAVLAFGWLIAVLSLPAFLVAQATGRERLSTFASLVTVSGTVLGLRLLTADYGLSGASVGVASGLIAGALAIQVLFSHSFGDWRLLWPFSPAGLATGLLSGLAAWRIQQLWASGWTALGLAGLGAAAVAAVGLIWAGPLGPALRRWPPAWPPWEPGAVIAQGPPGRADSPGDGNKVQCE